MRGLMSPAKAEEFLGLPPSTQGRSLLKRALSREKEKGRRFVIREGGPKQVRYKLTAELIRRHLPELWEGRFERLSRQAKATIDRVEAHIDAHIDERIEAHPTVQRLAEESATTMQRVSRLATQVERIAKSHT